MQLTQSQADLLVKLVRCAHEQRLRDPITPIPIEPTGYAIYLLGDESIRLRWISDLDALCDAGMLSYRWNRQGNGRLYSLTPAGFRLVEQELAPLETALYHHRAWPSAFARRAPAGPSPATPTDSRTLTRQFNDLSGQLKESLGAFLTADELAVAIGCLLEVRVQVQSAAPNLGEIGAGIHSLGQLALAHWTPETAAPVGHSLRLLGRYAEIVARLLPAG